MLTKCKICNYSFEVALTNPNDSENIVFRCPECNSLQKIAQVNVESLKEDLTTIFEKKNNSKILGAKLTTIDKEGKKIKSFILKKGLTIIGRNEQNIVFVGNESSENQDSSISRKHFVIEMQKDKVSGDTLFQLSDHQSKNGVFLNGIKLTSIQKLFLKNDDIISIGKMHFKFNNIKV